MKGRHHVAISLAIASLLIIPLVFLENKDFLTYGIAFIVAVIIGSLIPDADCGGKPKLYYDFKPVYYIMLPLMIAIRWFYNLRYIKSKLKINVEIKDEHRGIMHSPLGILTSSILLFLILGILLIIIGSFDIFFILIVFLGVLSGQFLHLIEDTCTVSGINWKTPFKQESESKGGIYTFEAKESEVTDIRPMIYSSLFGGIAIVLFLARAINESFAFFSLNLILIYLIIVLIICFEIFFMLLCSQVFSKNKKPDQFWIRKKEEVKHFRKQFRGFARKAQRIQ